MSSNTWLDQLRYARHQLQNSNGPLEQWGKPLPLSRTMREAIDQAPYTRRHEPPNSNSLALHHPLHYYILLGCNSLFFILIMLIYGNCCNGPTFSLQIVQGTWLLFGCTRGFGECSACRRPFNLHIESPNMVVVASSGVVFRAFFLFKYFKVLIKIQN